MSTELYLIRHGETDWNRLNLYQGTTDVPLNGVGREQAEALAARLGGVAFSAAYTSPLRRAADTARAVLRGTGVPLMKVRELSELSYGLWQGQAPGPGGRCDPAVERQWRQSPWTVRFPGGESLEDVRMRGTAALGAILAAHDGATVLVSGHGHLNRVLLIHLLGLPRESFWEIPQPNAACWRLEIGTDPSTGLRRAAGEPLHTDGLTVD
ncbi:MAG TPA: histidine phosphatase family protein [Longimicrobium sp.]